MAKDPYWWPLLAVLAALGTGYVIWALLFGCVLGKYGICVRAKDPIMYWITLVVCVFSVLLLWYIALAAQP